MIKKYKNFSIFKRKDVKSEKAPGYDATASYQSPDGTYEKSVNIGGVWLRDSKDGSKYFSGKLADTRSFEGNTFPGFCIVNEKELDDLISKLSAKQNSPLGNDYPVEGDDGVLNPADIPF